MVTMENWQVGRNLRVISLLLIDIYSINFYAQLVVNVTDWLQAASQSASRITEQRAQLHDAYLARIIQNTERISAMRRQMSQSSPPAGIVQRQMVPSFLTCCCCSHWRFRGRGTGVDAPQVIKK